MPFYRAGMLGLALLTIAQVTEANAQTVPVLGYVAAKNANPKRLEIFKKGLADSATSRERTSASNTARLSWMQTTTA